MRHRCWRTGRAAVSIAVAATASPAVAQPDTSALAGRIVVVRTYDQFDGVMGDISGFTVGGALIVTNAQMLRGAEAIVMVNPATAAEFVVEIRRFDERSGLALLEVPGLEAPSAVFASTASGGEPAVNDIVYVPRLAPDGSLGDDVTRGVIAELRNVAPGVAGERALVLYRHSAVATAREYGMPLLNECGEAIALVRPDPDLPQVELDARSDPRESAFGVSAREIGQVLAEFGVETAVSDSPCLDAYAEVDRQRMIAEQRADEAQAAQQAADEARIHAEEAQAQADALAARADSTAVERDAAREEAEAAAAEAQAALQAYGTAQQAADEAQQAADEAQAQVAQLEDERLLLLIVLASVAVLLLAVILLTWRLLARRRRQLAKAEAARQAADQRLADAVTPAPFACLLEGTDKDGRSVVVKIGADQLGAPDGVVVGRNPASAGIVLDHPEASREHFRLAVRGDGLLIEDMDSTNGTFVNGNVVRPRQPISLSAGDTIAVGGAMRLTVSMPRAVP